MQICLTGPDGHLGCCVDVGIFLEQQLHHVEAAVRGGLDQGGAPFLQVRDGKGVPVAGVCFCLSLSTEGVRPLSKMTRSWNDPLQETHAVDGVDGGPFVEQQLHHGQQIVFDRQVLIALMGSGGSDEGGRAHLQGTKS
jgi:hypothetical protein